MGLIIRFLINFFKKKSSDKGVMEFSADEFESVKFKARIALIDDDEIPHVKRLQRDGYNVTDYPDIDNIDDFIRKKYHVVVLDIQNVGKNLSQSQEGWGLLKYLKEECPHLVVIMFTGADWSITKYKHLADLADDFIGKDLEFLDFKSRLDSGIRKAFSPKFHFQIERAQILKEISNADTLSKIESIVQAYGKDRSKTLKELKGVTNSDQVIQRISNYLSIIDSIFSLVT